MRTLLQRGYRVRGFGLGEQYYRSPDFFQGLEKIGNFTFQIGSMPFRALWYWCLWWRIVAIGDHHRELLFDAASVKAIARGPSLGQMRPDLGIEFGFTDGETADGVLLTD